MAPSESVGTVLLMPAATTVESEDPSIRTMADLVRSLEGRTEEMEPQAWLHLRHVLVSDE